MKYGTKTLYLLFAQAVLVNCAVQKNIMAVVRTTMLQVTSLEMKQ